MKFFPGPRIIAKFLTLCLSLLMMYNGSVIFSPYQHETIVTNGIDVSELSRNSSGVLSETNDTLQKFDRVGVSKPSRNSSGVLSETNSTVQKIDIVFHWPKPLVDEAPKRFPLYIYVDAFMEGMSSWMVSLTELMQVAKRMNATLVEPCMKDGRLKPCTNSSEVRLFEIFDVGRVNEFHSKWHHELNFGSNVLRKENIQIIKTCMFMSYSEKQPETCTDNRFREASWPALEEAWQSAQQKETVLYITTYRKRGLNRMKLRNEESLIDRNNTDKYKTDYLRFHPNQIAFVDKMLDTFFSDAERNNFAVVHWRGERKGMNYLKCARYIKDAQKNIRKRNANSSSPMRFFLMSSLNFKSEYMWSGAYKMQLKSNDTKNEALQLLLHSEKDDHNNFVKVDSLYENGQLGLDNIQDLGLLAVWDIIIAMKATVFATCVKGCHAICRKCNFLGNFAQLSVSLRADVMRKNSHQCWPITQ